MKDKVDTKVYLCQTCGHVSQYKADKDVRWTACPSCGENSYGPDDSLVELENYWETPPAPKPAPAKKKEEPANQSVDARFPASAPKPKTPRKKKS